MEPGVGAVGGGAPGGGPEDGGGQGTGVASGAPSDVGGSAFDRTPVKGTRGDELRLVQVAYAANLPEAEMIQGLLRQEHIPSMVERAAPFNAPDFLVAGRRVVLVPASHADRARELLG